MKRFKSYDSSVYGPQNTSIEADFAATCIERWGMVAGIPDGEDSAGRSKLRLATPEELVDRAFMMARLFMERCETDGHFKDLGPVEQRELLQQGYDCFQMVKVKTKSIEDEFAESKKG